MILGSCACFSVAFFKGKQPRLVMIYLVSIVGLGRVCGGCGVAVGTRSSERERKENQTEKEKVVKKYTAEMLLVSL